jgi:hypothetical protein
MRAFTALSCAACLLMAGCAKSEIPVYRLEDSAVAFQQVTNNFSLRGMTEPERVISVNIQLIGPASEEARPIAIEIEEVTARQGVDFTVESCEVPAGALSGALVLKVKKLPEGTNSRTIKVTLLPNEYLREGYKAYLTANVTWTDSYERPIEYVWRYWHLYLSKSYSRDYHKLLVELFGDEMETYCCSRTYADNYGLTYKLPTWWFATNHELTEIIRKHDLANPGAPYRHSGDYEVYSSYLKPVGGGDGLKEGETPPTILETLNNL